MVRSSILAVALLIALPATAAADVLELKDGRLVEGMVIEDGSDLIVLSRFGPTSFKTADIVKRTKAKPVDEQIREHLAKLPEDDTKNRALLAQWLKKLGRDADATNLAQSVLQRDPESDVANNVLGNERYKGRWMTPEDAMKAQGLERHGDRWFTPDEWKNVSKVDRDAAAAKDNEIEHKRLGADVNRMLRLITSPDRAVRARAKSRLTKLAEELDSDPLRELVKNIDEYVRQVDEVRTKANEIASGTASLGHVTGEFRATVARLKRPIRNFTTNLASGPIGANAPVTLQLPELEVIKVRTTGIIPVVGP